MFSVDQLELKFNEILIKNLRDCSCIDITNLARKGLSVTDLDLADNVHTLFQKKLLMVH